MAVKPIPDGFQAVIPYLLVEDVGQELEFTKAAFGAEEIERVEGPEGRVMHGEARVAGCVVMMGCARAPEYPPVASMIYLYVEDCDAVYQRALGAGGTSVQEPTNAFYGDRNAGVQSPSGIKWWIATHVEDVSPEEIARRAAEQGKPDGS